MKALLTDWTTLYWTKPLSIEGASLTISSSKVNKKNQNKKADDTNN